MTERVLPYDPLGFYMRCCSSTSAMAALHIAPTTLARLVQEGFIAVMDRPDSVSRDKRGRKTARRANRRYVIADLDAARAPLLARIRELRHEAALRQAKSRLANRPPAPTKPNGAGEVHQPFLPVSTGELRLEQQMGKLFARVSDIDERLRRIELVMKTLSVNVERLLTEWSVSDNGQPEAHA